MAISTDAKKTISELKSKLRTNVSFDIIFRDININGREAGMFFIDGFTKDEVMEKIMEFFYSLKSDDDFKNSETFIKNCIPYIEVACSKDINSASTNILSGLLLISLQSVSAACTHPRMCCQPPGVDSYSGAGI